jgi:pilus assembly protein CpaB
MREMLQKTLRSLWREKGLTVLGIVAGAAGFLLARQYLATADRNLAAKYAQDYAPRRVLVAAASLSAGETLTAAQLAVRNMPQRFLPSGTVPADALDTVLDARLRVPMRAGDPLERGLLRAASPSLATRLPVGTRGLTLGCDALGPLGGMLHPGDRLDVWLADEGVGSLQADRANSVADVLVVATSEDSTALDERDAAAGPCSLTLRVAPSQAVRLLAAASSGGIAAVLRSSQEPAPIFVPPPEPGAEVRSIRVGHDNGGALELLSADGQTLSRQWLAATVLP